MLARRNAALNPTSDPQALALRHSTGHLPPSLSHPSTIDPSELALPRPSVGGALALASTAGSPTAGACSSGFPPADGSAAAALRSAESSLAQSLDDLRVSSPRRRAGDADDDDDDEGDGAGDGRERWGVSCSLVIHRLDDGFAARANHIPTYFELNRQVRPLA